ncbi:MAG: hypothetical protein WBR18_04335 [Anaerolineales bacterium]
MASVYDLIQKYRPELELEEPVPAEEVIEYMAENGDLDPESIRKVFDAVPDMLFWFLVRGRPVQLPGVGEIRPTIELNGTIRAALKADPSLVERMSEDDAYRGGVNRNENIGLSLERLAQMWNSTHPDDPATDVDAYAIVSG